MRLAGAGKCRAISTFDRNSRTQCHFDQGLLTARQLRFAASHQIGVDIHLGHIIDDRRPSRLTRMLVEQRRLARTQKAGQHRTGRRACEASTTETDIFFYRPCKK